MMKAKSIRTPCHRPMRSEASARALINQGYQFLHITKRMPSTDPEDVNYIAEPVKENGGLDVPIRMETLCADIQFWVEEKWFQQAA